MRYDYKYHRGAEKENCSAESQGYMLIEFKLWANKAISLIHRLGYENEMDTHHLMLVFFSCKATIGVTEKLKEFGVRLTETLKPLLDVLDSNDLYVESSIKYPFIRNLGRKYEVRYKEPVIYHRCRNNC